MRAFLLVCALLWAAQAEAASRFWVGGTGTWDSSTTTHWAASSGGAGGQTVPGSGDDVTFDGSSGGGTVTINNASNTIQSLTCGAFTGTIDNSANNNNVTITGAGGTGFNCSGSGTRTINMGSGTWNIQSSGFNLGTTTGLTFANNGGTITLSGGSDGVNWNAPGITFGTVNFNLGSGKSVQYFGNTQTFGHFGVAASTYVLFQGGATLTISNAPTFTGGSGTEIGFTSSTATSSATISVASGSVTGTWMSMRRMTFTGGASFNFTNSFDLGQNSGATISAPGGGGGSGFVGVMGAGL